MAAGFSVGVATTFIVGLIGLFLLAPFVFGFTSVDDGFDDGFGDDYYVEQGSVSRAMGPACDDLAEIAETVPLFGSAASGADSIAKLADGARGVGVAIDGARPDDQAELLSDDWKSVATALDDFGARLATDPAARLDLPTVNGVLVSDRISWGNDTCFVPSVVTALDPDAATDSFAF